LRGFLSLVLVLVLLSAVFLATSTHVASSARIAGSEADALLVERQYYARAELREAVLLTMGQEARDEDEVAERLARLDDFVRAEYASDGIDAFIWCGLSDEAELGRLPERMQELGDAVACENCWNPGDMIEGVCCKPNGACRPDSRSPCELILSLGNGNITVVSPGAASFTDAGEACEYPAIGAARGRKAVLGASIHNGRLNYSAVVILPQGLVVKNG